MHISTELNKFSASIENICLTIGLFYFKYLSGICVFIEGKCLLCLNRYITLICQCKCLAYINGLSGLNLSCKMIDGIVIILGNRCLAGVNVVQKRNSLLFVVNVELKSLTV